VLTVKYKVRARPTMKRTTYRYMGDFDGKYKLELQGDRHQQKGLS
jgi:hypothetical protein